MGGREKKEEESTKWREKKGEGEGWRDMRLDKRERGREKEREMRGTLQRVRVGTREGIKKGRDER